MRDKQIAEIKQFDGGISHKTDAAVGTFSDSVNLLPDKKMSRLNVREGLKHIATVSGCYKQIAMTALQGSGSQYDSLVIPKKDNVKVITVDTLTRCYSNCSNKALYNGCNGLTTFSAYGIGSAPYATGYSIDGTFIIGNNGYLGYFTLPGASTSIDSTRLTPAKSIGAASCSFVGAASVSGCSVHAMDNTKGRLFVGYGWKTNNYSFVQYHSVVDTRAFPRYYYWVPANMTSVVQGDGHTLTQPTAAFSYLTGVVATEGGLVLLFTDRIMLWQWSDTSFPHDISGGGARIETLFSGIGCPHSQFVRKYNNSIYFIGERADGIRKVIQLTPEMSLNELGDEIDYFIHDKAITTTKVGVASAIWNEKYVFLIDNEFYVQDLKTNALYRLDFGFTLASGDNLTMAVSSADDLLYIGKYDSAAHTLAIYAFPGDTSLDAGAAIPWSIEYNNIDVGESHADKWVRDIQLDVDSEYNDGAIAIALHDAMDDRTIDDGSAIKTVSKTPAKDRHSIEKYEFNKRVKNVGIKVSGCYHDAGCFASCYTPQFGLNSIRIRVNPRTNTKES
jgi:hypothetical protein